MEPQAREIAPEDVVLDAFVAIVDLREGNRPSGEIPGSTLIDRLDLDGIERLIPHPDSPILLYCGIGEASRIAAKSLAGRGFTGVVSLLGGFRRWRAGDHPISTVGEPTPDRYDRHVRLAGFGPERQDRLRSSRVLVVGAGGLGSPVIQYLAAAGVGTIGIVDGDRVDATNLHRQVLFGEDAIGMSKVDAAVAAVADMNHSVAVDAVARWFDADNAAVLIDGCDLVVDASDNFATRLAVNDAAAALGVPFVHGAAIRWEGMVAAFNPRVGPCYRCLFPDLPESEATCRDVGVLGPVTGVIGSLMAVEAIKHIVGSPDRMLDRLITYDARSTRFSSVRIKRRDTCPIGHVVGSR
jgi:molybdopterin/thiamine biosynthesis adenylyltransferase/rhodanese-related sulfurtransferase